jgi:hypothetical protein
MVSFSPFGLLSATLCGGIFTWSGEREDAAGGWKIFLPSVFQVTIITSGAVVAEDSSVASLHHQQVALLATANGTHIAVQVS